MVFSAPLHIQQTFKRLGFSSNEVKILLCLLQKKQATAQEVSKKTLIAFSSAEYLLQTMVKRGLATSREVKGGDVYMACNEAELKEWLIKDRNRVNSIYDTAEEELESFLHEGTEEAWKPDVSYYEGVEGIKEIYEDMLISSNGNIYSWLDIPKIKDTLGDYLYAYISKRQKKGIVSHDIIPENEMNLTHNEKNEKREMKFVKHLPLDGEIRIYGDKVALITFSKEKPVGFVFHGKIITELFKSIFDSQWRD
ncbi:MAG: helix-turn-helix domain-containing protein [Candidatus Peregrinibacteria bacterium]